MIRSIGKNSFILAAVALVATTLVAFTFSLTKGRIIEQQQKQRTQLLSQIIPAKLHDNILTDSCTLIVEPSLAVEPVPAYIASLNGIPKVIALEAVAPDGYSGNIRIIVAVNNDDNILGLRVLNHQETPGLGDKIDINVTQWVDQFVGKSFDSRDEKRFAVKKDGGQFDQFTGATITPRAVVNATKRVLQYVAKYRQQILSQPKNCGAQQ